MSGDPLVAAIVGLCSAAFGAWLLVRRSDLVLPHASRMGFEPGSRSAKLYAIWVTIVLVLCVVIGLGMLALAWALVALGAPPS